MSKVTMEDIAQRYQLRPNLAKELPWRDYDDETACFLLEDGVSVGAVFEITDVSCEGRGSDFIESVRQRFEKLLQSSIKQESTSPYILQIYLEDIKSLSQYKNELRSYIKNTSRLTQKYLNIMDEHCDYLLTPGGIFHDNLVSNNRFGARRRVVRAVLYRRITKKTHMRRGQEITTGFNAVCTTFLQQVKSTGAKIKRYKRAEFLEWLVRWFNPAPKSFKSTDALVEAVVTKKPTPFGYDLAEQVFFQSPKSSEDGVWLFDNKPHKYIPISALATVPEAGQLSAERENYGKWQALFDLFPEGSVFVITIIIQEKTQTEDHIKYIEKAAIGTSALANITKKQTEQALYQIASGNQLYPTCFGAYIKAENLDDLIEQEQTIEGLLTNNGFKVTPAEFNLVPHKVYLKNLPMAYDYEFDRKKLYLAKYVYASHLAALLPFYGRYRGSGNHLYNYLNRLGEPFSYDILSIKDKSFCSHVLTIGTTGSGKSASTVWKIMQLLAVYNARIFIVEAGNSFDMLMEYLPAHGITTNDVVLKKNKLVSLNPFADAYKLLDSIGDDDLTVNSIEDSLKDQNKPQESLDVDEERDILGEMALAAELMITGGDKDATKLTRQDRYTIVQAIKLATKTAFESKKSQVLTEDIVEALQKLAADPKNIQLNRVARINELAESMAYFTVDDIGAKLFNTIGNPWPDVDVTRLDLGIMKNEGYEAHLGISFMGAANKFLAICEAAQFSGRPTVFFCDECHLILKLPVPAAAATKISKMSRKINLWLNFLTQNLADFSDDSTKMLSMFEFYECLGLSESELRLIQKFKTLTEEQISLFLSVRKEIGKYIEGVVISEKINGLFRSVPPRLALALAKSDPDEKTKRRQLMQKLNITESQAAELDAKDMMVIA